MKHLIALVEEFESLNVGFQSLTKSINTTTPGGKLFFHLIGALAEFERNIIVERTRAGLAAARARGRLGGRPKKLSRVQEELVREFYVVKRSSLNEICQMFAISKTTLYAILKR